MVALTSPTRCFRRFFDKNRDVATVLAMAIARLRLFILTGYVGLCACSERLEVELSEVPAQVAQPSSVFLVTIDTLRADRLGVYGNERIKTPNLDRLADDGSVFLKAFAQSSTTTPSHASLFSGLYSRDHQAYSNFESIDQSLPNLASDFAVSGYETMALVNMRHLNPGISGIASHFETVIESDGYRNVADSVETLLGWLDSRPSKSRPVFVWLHLVDVHTPYSPPPPFDRLYYDGDQHARSHDSLDYIWPSLPDYLAQHASFQAWLKDVRDVDWVVAQYDGAVTYVDYHLGRLFKNVEKSLGPHDKPGWIITSDHGENLGEHSMHFVHTGLYDTTIQVPLIISLPGLKRGEPQVHDLVELVDLRPTLLDYLGLETIEASRGRSLLPLLRGELAEDKDFILSEHAGRSLVALRTHEWKYILHQRSSNVEKSYPFVEGQEELYDLTRDPLERNNLASNQSEIIFDFRRKLHSISSLENFVAGARPEIRAKDLEELRALGYVE